MSTHEWVESAAPYALGALDDAERESFERHLAGCEACRREVSQMRDVVRLLALAAPDVAPPESLRERILAGARGARPGAASDVAGAAPPAGSVAPGGSGSRARSPGMVAGDVRSRARSAWTIAPWLAVAASIALAVVFGARAGRERDARTAAERSLASLRAALDSAGATLASRDSLIASLVAPDVQTVSVTTAGPSASARYYWNRRASRVVLAAFSLPPAATGRTYQLWGIASGQAPVSLGTFTPDAAGRALVTVPVPAGLRLAVTAITDEPAGGSAQPTTTPFLAATWRTE